MLQDDEVPEVLWHPTDEQVADSAMATFRRQVNERRGLSLGTYDDLWRWSVDDPESFWSELASFFDVSFHRPPQSAVAGREMPGAEWFPGATLNYAEHALRPGDGKSDDDVAIIFRREDGLRQTTSYGQLRAQVTAARAALAGLGVTKGDRVAALVPNSPHALVAFLATASLGAIWSSCSPDFGTQAISDRFVQLEPKVFISIDGYRYGGKHHDVRATAAAVSEKLPHLRAHVQISYVGDEPPTHNTTSWDDLLAGHTDAELTFEPVAFDHPLWVLYSSGTTGLPKGIVHGHGGIVLEHLKAVGLHSNLGPGDRFFWYTTTGWMMWNFLISGLLVGSTVVLYDGSPVYPDASTLWAMAEEVGVAYFGTSAPFVHANMKSGVTPRTSHDLSALRTIGSTGAPLSPEGFRWILDAMSPNVQIASVSGGTDLCTAFVGASPDVPVWLGELSCRMLGAAVKAFDESGREVVDEVGELVITEPMPSMPVSFWNDEDGTRLRAAYFEDFPGVWRHGDWIKITPRGSAVIYGRSDATLNRGGVRMGTAEFYRVVEGHPNVTDSLVIDTSGPGGDDGQVLCFVVLAAGSGLADVMDDLRAELRTQLSPRHVPDRFIAVDDVPRTLNGKKCEVPVKKILTGTPPEKAMSRDALANPGAMDAFVYVYEQLRDQPR